MFLSTGRSKLAAGLALTVPLALGMLALSDGDRHAAVQAPAAAQGAVAAREGDAGHRRMLELLAQIGRDQPMESAFDTTVEQLRGQLGSLPSTAPVARRIEVVGSLAEAELRRGHNIDAVGHFEEALELIRQLPVGGSLPLRMTTEYWLGVANLRRALQQACVHEGRKEACSLPLEPLAADAVGGVGSSQSREAVEHFDAVVRSTPVTQPLYLAARWLLNLAHMAAGDYPHLVPSAFRIEPRVFRSDTRFPAFEDVAPALGLNTMNLAGGAAVDDYDGDGYLDIVTSTMDPNGQLRLFQNRGDGSFIERTTEAGLEGIYGALNIVQADYDGDGDLDLYMPRGAWMRANGRWPDSLLRNNGDLTFTDVTFDAGLGESHYPAQAAAFADFDLDGDLDLFIGSEASGDLGYPSKLFRNDGDGTFTDVASGAGVENRRWAKGVAWSDFDGDGDPDLYVSNYQDVNRYYRNDGDGTFTDVADELGVARPTSSFSTWAWDVNNDGNLDLLVNGYQMRYSAAGPDVWYIAADRLGMSQPAESPALYLGDGAGGFRDAATDYGLAHPTLPMGANFGDIDNDGFPDFYLGTGYPGVDGMIPNVLYRNVGGERFVDVTFAGGFGHLFKGHGIAFADLDNDGDQDVFAQIGGMYPDDAARDALFENPGFGNRWLTVDLIGTRANRHGVLALIRVHVVEGDSRRAISHLVGSGGSFGSDPIRAEIGLGAATAIERVEIRWPGSNEVQVVEGVEPDTRVRITQGADGFVLVNAPAVRFAPGGPAPPDV